MRRFGLGAFAAVISLALAPIGTSLLASSAGSDYDDWWQPGATREFAKIGNFENSSGTLRVEYIGEPIDPAKHAFFKSLGRNGRACVTCHQPASAMSISSDAATRVWETSGYKDPLFSAIDGSNCPTLPQEKRESHSLLIDHGLIRVSRPWPPLDAAGKRLVPDFRIEVVRDPSGCNLDPTLGLASRNPAISVFRRPRVAANLKYVEATGFPWDPKPGLPLPIDPETGKPSSGNLMSDRRFLSLAAQARDAASGHLEATTLTSEQLTQILSFERQLYAAQQSSIHGGELSSHGGLGGTQMLIASPPARLGSQGVPIWSEFEAWGRISDKEKSDLSPAQIDFRRSVARGAKSFRDRTFLISDTGGMNSPMTFGNPIRNACAFCHGMSQTGMDVAPGQVDIGTNTVPYANPQPWLPLFRITCLARPHPFYGRVLYTTDPGYALTTGRCADVGKITIQSLRGLSARAPYFANGSAETLGAIIDYYDRRYRIGYTSQERQDLINLLSVL